MWKSQAPGLSTTDSDSVVEVPLTAGDVALWVECLPSIREALGSVPHQPGMCTCLSPQVETGESALTT